MSHLVQFMSLFGVKVLSAQPWKCHSKTCATLSHIWATTSKVVNLKKCFIFKRWAITFDFIYLFIFFSNCGKVKIDQSDGVLLRNEKCHPPSATVESARRKMLMVVVFQSRTVCSCEFKRVGDKLLPEQSKSWLRHSSPCAPNHTAVLSARGYNQGNTSKLSLQSSSASRAGLWNVCT